MDMHCDLARQDWSRYLDQLNIAFQTVEDIDDLSNSGWCEEAAVIRE
jgi:hypothetical protein